MEVHTIKFKTGFTGALWQPDLSGELGSFDLRGLLKVARPQKREGHQKHPVLRRERSNKKKRSSELLQARQSPSARATKSAGAAKPVRRRGKVRSVPKSVHATKSVRQAKPAKRNYPQSPKGRKKQIP